MTILLVRHARAGRRDRWKGDDRLRPLSNKGKAQARALPDLLAEWIQPGPPRLLSSPWVRCIESLAPLSSRVNVPIEPEDTLAEGMGDKAVEMLPGRLGRRTTVLCTHGDVVERILGWLQQQGVDLGPKPQAPKGSVWVLEGTRAVRRASYLAPPA